MTWEELAYCLCQRLSGTSGGVLSASLPQPASSTLLSPSSPLLCFYWHTAKQGRLSPGNLHLVHFVVFSGETQQHSNANCQSVAWFIVSFYCAFNANYSIFCDARFLLQRTISRVCPLPTFFCLGKMPWNLIQPKRLLTYLQASYFIFSRKNELGSLNTYFMIVI